MCAIQVEDYTEQVSLVGQRLLSLPTQYRNHTDPHNGEEGNAPVELILDTSSVGRSVVDMFAALKPIRIAVTGGIAGTKGVGTPVHRRDLAALLQRILSERRVRVAAGLPLRETLTKELQSFRYTPPKPEAEYVAREREDDDIVLAVGCALFAAERGYSSRPISFNFRKW